MSGVGQTGVWRSGVWVEPLDAEGEFALSASAVLEYTGRFAFGKPFNLEATGDLTFSGAQFFLGEFEVFSSSDLAFTGTGTVRPGQGIFGLEAEADASFTWLPRVSGPSGGVEIGDLPAKVVVKLKPGAAVIVNGIAGIVVLDKEGRLVVQNQAGQVMCIIGSAGVDFNETPGVEF